MGELADLALEYGIDEVKNPGSFFLRSACGSRQSFVETVGFRQPYEGKWKFVRESGGKSRPGGGGSVSLLDRYTLTIKTRGSEDGISQEALTKLFSEQVYFPPRPTNGVICTFDEINSNFNSAHTTKAELLREYIKRKYNITAERRQQLKADCKTIGELVTDFYFLNGSKKQSDTFYIQRNRSPDFKIFGDCGELTKAQYDLQRGKKASMMWACGKRNRVRRTNKEDKFNGWMFPDGSQGVDEPQDHYTNGKTAGSLGKTDNRTKDAKAKKYFRFTKWIVFGGPGFHFPNLKVLKINFIRIKKLVLSVTNAPKLELLWIEQVNHLEHFRFSLPSLKVLQLDHAYSLNARDLANSISASPSLKKLVFVKNYGMARMPPIYLPCLKEVDCWRGEDLNRFVFYSPTLQDAKIKLDRMSVDEFKVRGEFKRFEKFDNFVQSFFLENGDLVQKCNYFQEHHEKYWNMYTTSENRFRMILNEISNPDLAMQVLKQGLKIWSTVYVDAFAASGNEAFYNYYTVDMKSEYGKVSFDHGAIGKELADETTPKRQKTEP